MECTKAKFYSLRVLFFNCFAWHFVPHLPGQKWIPLELLCSNLVCCS